MGSSISVIRHEILHMRVCSIPSRCHLLGGGLYLTTQRAHLSLPRELISHYPESSSLTTQRTHLSLPRELISHYPENSSLTTQRAHLSLPRDLISHYPESSSLTTQRAHLSLHRAHLSLHRELISYYPESSSLTTQRAHLSLPHNKNTRIYCTRDIKFKSVYPAALTRGSIRLGDVARARCSVVVVATTLQRARSGVRIPTVAKEFFPFFKN